jgi:hypothetical protein
VCSLSKFSTTLPQTRAAKAVCFFCRWKRVYLQHIVSSHSGCSQPTKCGCPRVWSVALVALGVARSHRQSSNMQSQAFRLTIMTTFHAQPFAPLDLGFKTVRNLLEGVAHQRGCSYDGDGIPKQSFRSLHSPFAHSHSPPASGSQLSSLEYGCVSRFLQSAQPTSICFGLSFVCSWQRVQRAVLPHSWCLGRFGFCAC